MEPKKNLIVSHGGRHGKSAGTYMRGSKIPRDASKHVPNTLLHGDSEEPDAAGTKPVPLPKPWSSRNEEKEVVATSKGGKVDFGPPEAPPAAREAPADPEPKEEPTVIVDATEAPETPESDNVDLPTSKSQLNAMRKGELVALADALDVDSSGTADEIRARLTEELF